MAEKIDYLAQNPFLDSPAQYLVKTVVSELEKVALWKTLFGSYIEPYKRMDFPMRSFPALRVYENGYTKEFESWFINGDLIIDIIWPASIRRSELQLLQDHVSAALLQQFRRPSFFAAVENLPAIEAEEDLEGYRLLGVPGLNELGKRFTVDKSLGFMMPNDDVVPLTQITVNFRIDLRQWDEYLTENLRTKDDPFEQTLEELTQMVGTIEGLVEDGSVGLSTTEVDGLDQEPGGES